MERIFLALMLGGELSKALHAQVLRSLAPGGGRQEAWEAPAWLRLYEASDIHMTLAFLGNTETSSLLPLRDFLRDALAELEEPCVPNLLIDHTGCFPRRGRERVLWAGVRGEGVDAVQRLAEVARSALSFSVAPREETRPFAPHLTLARVRAERMPRKEKIPAAFYEVRPDLPWTPGQLSIVRSLRGSSGPAYEVVHALDLSGCRS